jgi:glycosyltransferase involved in cell wall biosynthesis
VAKRLPLVSVLVPTYNGAAFLDQTLASIEQQSYRRLEVIIRDDGSRDATLDIAQSYVDRDSRFRIVRSEKNHGALANVLGLAALAEGQYIKYCNHDDLLDVTCVETLIGPLQEDRRISFATSTRRLIDGDGNELPPRAWSMPLVEENRVLTGVSVASRTLLTGVNQIGEATTVLFRNGLVPAARLFWYRGHEYSVNADIALWLNLLARGNIYVHAAPLSSFRQHGGQRSAERRVHIDGALEWLTLFEGGLSSGIIKPGAPALLAARNVVLALCGALSGVMQAGDAGLYDAVPRLTDAVTRAWQLQSGIALDKVIERPELVGAGQPG